MSDSIDTLYPLVRVASLKLIDLLKKEKIDGRIVWTARTVEDQKKIYGKERWTLHYIGLAVDWYPNLHCNIDEWQNKFNTWPHWDRMQCELAVTAGFDRPQQWQIQRDRPHLQCLCGQPDERYYRRLWYDMHKTKDQIWKEIDKCLKHSNGTTPH